MNKVPRKIWKKK